MGTGQSLGWEANLPYKYKNLRITEGTRPIGFRFSNYIINIEATLNDHKILACGEDLEKEIAVAKSISELLERSALLTCPSSFSRVKTSNGWSSHPVQLDAELNAMFEVIERDGVLSNWYLRKPFIQIKHSTLPKRISEWTESELSRSEYPVLKLLLSTEGLGPSVTCLLMNKKGYGVTGHASGRCLEKAIDSAITEACRSAHHALRMSYWNESLLLNDADSRVSPGAHAVFYAYHRPFPNWIFGKEVDFAEVAKSWVLLTEELIRTKNGFQFHSFLSSPVHTVLAMHPESIQIEWGSRFNESLKQTVVSKRFSTKLIDGAFNLEPHFVA